MKLQSVIHHIEYMPSGEQFLEQRSTWGTSYKFNSKELDAETGLYYYGARYYNPNLSIWGSVDPMSDKYPSMSPYMYCAGNPVILVDPDGMEFYVADNDQSRNDIKSLVSDDNQKRISYGDNGRIKIDTKGMTDKEIKADVGLSLLIDMDNSDKKMLYESTEMTTINNEDCVTFQFPVYNNNNTDGIINASVGGKDGLDGYTFKPKDGFDGQVSIAASGKYSKTNGRNGRTSLVFHELAENYYRTDFGIDYNDSPINGNSGAHSRASEREGNYYNNPTPGKFEKYQRK